MAPPGRRRNPLSILSVLLCGILFFSHTACAASAVLGIDIGTEYIKAALVKPGMPLEIVLSKDSKRKETSAVAFKPPRKGTPAAGTFPEREYGGDALALAARFPGDVYPNLKQLLGHRFDTSSVVKSYALRYPALEIVQAEPRGSAAFKSKSFHADEKPFSVEELLAMELKNVRENAQALAGKGHAVESAVFTIPPFYTLEERRALELAAELAGLKVLGVISDGLAVGINYATSRTFESINEKGKPEYHLVFDMGAGSTTATVLRMQGRTIKDVGRFNKTIQEVTVMGAGWDRTLGGDALNSIIVQDMVESFLKSPGAKSLGKSAGDVLSHGRTTAKLLREAEKVRQVLSANQEIGASFEGLYEDVDFRYKLSRPNFEKLIKEFVDRLDTPVNAALKTANITMADLESVILHGGAVRTPFVQKKLESLAGGASKLRTNVNADEAAVFGAAFKAARLSPSFRVKEIHDHDAANYATWLKYQKEKDGKTHQLKLFTPTSTVGKAKRVPFNKLEDFEFQMYQTRPADPGSPGESKDEAPTTTTFETKNLTASVSKLMNDFGCKRENITTNFSIRLDPILGLPEVVSGTVSCDYEVTEKKGGVVDDVKNFLGFGKKDDGDQKVLGEGDGESSTSTSTSTSKSTSASGSSSSASDSASAASSSEASTGKESKVEDSKPAPPKIKTEVIKIAFQEKPDERNVLPKEDTIRMAARLSEFDSSDEARRSREEDLNSLEAFTYKARDLLTDDSFTRYSNEEQRSGIEALVKSTSEWLYEEGPASTSDVLKLKLKDLKKLVGPVQKRRQEAQKRPEVVQMLRDALNQAQILVKMIKEAMETSESVKSSLESASLSTTSSTASADAPKLADTASSEDPLAELEHDESSTPTTSTEAAAPTFDASWMSPYTEDDLVEITNAYDSITAWLEEKLAAQEKLAPYEDPVFASGELKKKSEELNRALMKVLQKKIKVPKPSKSKSSKSAKATKKAKKASKDESKDEKKGKKQDADNTPAVEELKVVVEKPKTDEVPKKQTEPKSKVEEEASSDTRERDEL